MDYITLYLIMATVFLLFISSLIVVSNMEVYSVNSRTATKLSHTTRLSHEPCSGSYKVVPEKTELGASYETGTGNELTVNSTISVGTNSAAILTTTLFLLVNFESAIDSNIVTSLSTTFSDFYGNGAAITPVSVLADTSSNFNSIFSQTDTSYSLFSKLIITLTFIVVISVKPYILTDQSLLVLLSTAGILLMASSTNFISFYLALELISLASYILVSSTITLSREQPKSGLVYATNSIVAGLNYFLLSALSSGLLILGISLIYYSTGELDFNSLARIFSSNSVVTSNVDLNYSDIILPQPSVSSSIGMCLVMTFVLFKLGASPFHYWVADVYEKVSIFVNYFLIVVAKLAMLFALMKLSFGMNLPLVENLLIVAVVSSLVIGSFAGLVQTKLRRLMAFSSINHVGYILLAYSFSLTKKVFFGVNDCEWVQGENLLGLDHGSMIITEFSKLSIASLWLYVTIYSLSTVCFFAILSLAVENGKHGDNSNSDSDSTSALNLYSTNLTLQRLNTLALFNINIKPNVPSSNPHPHLPEKCENKLPIPSSIFISASLTITLLSLAGVPPLAGFIAKIAIFWQTLDSGNWLLATVAVICSVIAAIYYLRIIALLYFYPAHPDTKIKSTDPATTASLPHLFVPPFDTFDVKPEKSSVTFLTALIIATITILLVVFPILNPSFIYIYMNH